VVACKLMWEKMRSYQSVTQNTCPNFNAELLLVNKLEYTMRIVFCPVVVVVKMYDGMCIKTCLVSKENSQKKVTVNTLLKSYRYKVSHAGESTRSKPCGYRKFSHSTLQKVTFATFISNAVSRVQTSGFSLSQSRRCSSVVSIRMNLSRPRL
jgi:hypothetical protein